MSSVHARDLLFCSGHGRFLPPSHRVWSPTTRGAERGEPLRSPFPLLFHRGVTGVAELLQLKCFWLVARRRNLQPLQQPCATGRVPSVWGLGLGWVGTAASPQPLKETSPPHTLPPRELAVVPLKEGGRRCEQQQQLLQRLNGSLRQAGDRDAASARKWQGEA